MEANNLEHTLKLFVVSSSEPPGSENSGNHADTWLDNDDASLMPDTSEASPEATGSQNSLEKAADASMADTGRCFKLKHLEIRHADEGFTLVTDTGSVLLQNGDRLALPDCHLRVQLNRRAAVSRAESLRVNTPVFLSDDVDIWQTAMPTESVGVGMSMIADPFNSPMVPAPVSTTQDPLGFLYGGGHLQQSDPNSLLYQASGLGALPYDPIPTIQSPMPQLPEFHAIAALDIDTQTPYQMTSTLADAPMGETRQSSYIPQSGEGNILRDLGIDESAAHIPEAPNPQAKSTFTEQSPMDMLDEFLGAEDMVSTGAHDAPYPAARHFSGLNAKQGGTKSLLSIFREIRKRFIS